MLNVNKTIENEQAVLALEGRLDTVTAPELDAVIGTIPEEIRELVLDFAALEYISSAGLRVLLTAQKRMTKRGSMRLIHVDAPIMEIFEVTGFSDILTIC